MWLRFLHAGTCGVLAAFVAFIAPSFALVLAVAVAYAHYHGLPVVQALFIAPAVMAIITAAYKLARMTNHRDLRPRTISGVLAVVTALTGAEIAVLFIAADLRVIPPPLAGRRWAAIP